MSNLLSYLLTGLPADASKQDRRENSFVGQASIAVMVMIMVLAMSPTWPLAIGVAAGCATLAYLGRLVFCARRDES